ncbi:MAG: hypothetical protein AAEJ04_06335 [Planctomycetota bacterium]
MNKRHEFSAFFLSLMLLSGTGLLVDQRLEAQSPARGSSIRPTTRPQVRPTTRPQVRPTTRPQVRPTTRPQVRPTTRPQVRPTTRPQVRPTTPQIRPTTRPQIRPTTPQIRPTTRPQIRPTTPQIRPTAPVTSSGRRSTTALPSRSRGTALPVSNRPTATRLPIVLHPPEITPAPLSPSRPLPALRRPDRNDRRELLGTVTFGDSRLPRAITRIRPGVRELKPGQETRDLIDRLARPRTTLKPGTGTLIKPGLDSVSSSSRRRAGIAISSTGPVALPPFPTSGGVATHTGGMPITTTTHNPVPWWCQPIYNHGGHSSHWHHHGPVWTYPWLVNYYTPWYLYDPIPWCSGWALPWVHHSSFHLIWWHHGSWHRQGSSFSWTSNYWNDGGYADSDGPIIVYAETTDSVDEEIIVAEDAGNLEVDLGPARTGLCDGWNFLTVGDSEAAVGVLDLAVDGLPEVGLPRLLRSLARLLEDDLVGAEADLRMAIELDPTLLASRWQENENLSARIDQVREQLWSRLEEDSTDASAALLLGTMSLLSEEIPDAPARGAVSEVLLAGEGDQATVAIHGALRGDALQQSLSPAAAWLENPDCDDLLEAIP